MKIAASERTILQPDGLERLKECPFFDELIIAE